MKSTNRHCFWLHLLPLLLLCMVGTVSAQNTVKGVLMDEDKGEAIPYARVFLEGTNYWSTTDNNGYFLINKVPDGTYTLCARFSTYEDFREELTLSHQTVVKNIKLRPKSRRMKEVVITSSKVEDRKIQTQVSVEKISSMQIQQMPSIGGQADLAQYLQVLPGVNSTGDQGGQLYIRGGSMIQNLSLLDGMIVYNPFHSIGLYSIFETDMILNADVYTGGFGAEYGGRLSSVLDITTRDGNKRHHTGKVGLNTFGASVLLEGPIKKETNESNATITYVLSAKNSFLSHSSKVIYPYIEGGLPFDFLDAYGKLSINSGMGSKVSFFGFRFDDRVNNYMSLADFHWQNYGAGTKFALMTGASSLIDGTIAYSKYEVNLEDGTNRPKYSAIGGFNITLGVTNFMGKNKLKCGFTIEGYSTDYRFTNAYGVNRSQDENTSSISAYATYNIRAGKWLLDPGLRLHYYASLNEPRIEPRFAAKYNINDKLRLKMASGLYSQIVLDARSDHDIVNLFNGFLTGSGQINIPAVYQNEPVESCVQRAQHVVVGLEYDMIEHLTMNMEFYYKNFSQLIGMNHNQIYDRTDPAYVSGGVYEQPFYLMTDFIIEKGYATGLDISACYDIERLYLWATYSLGYVERTDEIQTYNPHYDRRHTVNMLVTYALGEEREWELSGRWSFGSGYPFTRTQGVYERLSFDDGIGGAYIDENGTLGVYYSELYAGRLPSYHRLDLGLKRKFSFGKNGVLELSLSVTNVYDRNNIFYFDRITFSRVDQLPILVCAGINCSF
ncbi:MAG: TonB-dependent receptor [Bacteroidales bacterium]|nr:TonB-dependent receptor [Bacteroidales bacterium]